MRDGRVESVVELERWTGRKHDNRLHRYLPEILAAMVPPEEIVRFASVNAFVGSSFVSDDGNFRIEPRQEVSISDEPVPADVIWYPDGINRRPAEGWVVCHELAHVASVLPFCGSFENGALAAHVDGGAYRSASSFWRVESGRLRLEEASWEGLKDVVNNFNVNPAVRSILGFASEEHLSIPGKLMGYAVLGRPDGEMEEWLRSNGWFLGLDDRVAAEKVMERIGSLDPRNSRCQDLCASIQLAFEKAVVQKFVEQSRHSGTLYYSGGAGLNVPTNTKLLQYFDNVYVPPATNDSGLALGAAAWLEYLDRGSLPIHSPFLSTFDCPVSEPSVDAIKDVADALVSGKVIGVCNGAGEIGPRALGHRSILALADSVELRIRVSETIKKREWYRPLAPILCADAAGQVLEPKALESRLSRWMLGSWSVKPQWHQHLAGVVNVGGMVRAQVVDNDGHNEWMHALLSYLWEKFGVPALINTSFNGHGLPIVQRHDEALRLAAELGLDGVVVHGCLHRF